MSRDCIENYNFIPAWAYGVDEDDGGLIVKRPPETSCEVRDFTLNGISEYTRKAAMGLNK